MWNTVKSIQKSRWWTPLLFCLFASVPVGMVVDQFTVTDGLIPVINFGHRWKKHQLPAVRKLDVTTPTRIGYDGQFYAQLALDPFFQDPRMTRALDRPQYRARRIGLPFFAHVLGFGHTWWTLQIYAALNLVFWLLLCFVLWKTIGFKNLRDILLAISLLWTTGTLVSVGKALTDLPAAVISYLAVVLQGLNYWWASLLGLACLFKETTILSFATALPTFRKNGFFQKKSLIQAGLLLLPVTLWAAIVQWNLPTIQTAGMGNFSLPFVGISQKIGATFSILGSGLHNPQFIHMDTFFDILSLFSLFVQAIYLLIKPKWSDKIWLYGIGFALLFSILGPSVLVEQFAFTRVLLPLTFAFNLLIHRHEKQTQYYCWFILGNIGLGLLAFQFLLTSLYSLTISS